MKHAGKVIRKFSYTPAVRSDIKATFARLKREARELAQADEAARLEAQQKVAQLKGGKR